MDLFFAYYIVGVVVLNLLNLPAYRTSDRFEDPVAIFVICLVMAVIWPIPLMFAIVDRITWGHW